MSCSAVILIPLCMALTMCRPKTAAPAGAPQREPILLTDTIRTDTVSFGRMSTGEVATRKILLHNDTDKPIVILGTETSCGCLSLSYPAEPLAADSTVEAEMTFDSAGYAFFYPKTFRILTSLGPAPKKIVVTAEMH